METRNKCLKILAVSFTLIIQSCSFFGDTHFVKLDNSSVAIDPGTFKSYDFISLAVDKSISPVKVSASDVPAGRIWDFGIVEKSVSLLCTPRGMIEPAIYRVNGNTLHIDIGPRRTDGTLTFDCKASTTDFVFEVNYKANRSALISSNFFKNAYFETSEKPKISQDGKKALFVSYGQVYLKDTTSDAIYLISSPDGSIGHQANGAVTQAQMSADGSKVVFVSTSTNLIAGATGSQIYLKDLTANTRTADLYEGLI